MKRANYEVIAHSEDRVILRDLGPWDKYSSITNAAEDVIRNLHPYIKDKKVFYYDSEGDYGELVHDNNGQFVRFAFAKP